MKITEARDAYRTHIQSYREQQNILAKRKAELEKTATKNPADAVIYEKEMVIIELQREALEKKQTEYQDYMSKLAEFEMNYANLLVAKQQGEAMAEGYEDLGKIMEVARRIMKGDIVPATDERKLMEYSDELYQAAKNIGELMRQKEREEHKSLWEDEEAPEEPQDPMEAAGQMEAPGGPQMISPSDVMESVSSDTVQ